MDDNRGYHVRKAPYNLGKFNHDLTVLPHWNHGLFMGNHPQMSTGTYHPVVLPPPPPPPGTVRGQGQREMPAEWIPFWRSLPHAVPQGARLGSKTGK